MQNPYTPEQIRAWAARRESSPAHLYAALDDLIKIEQCIKQNPALIEAGDAEDATPLHYACATGTIAMIKSLLAYGAHINSLTVHNETPLLWIMFDRNDEQRLQKAALLLKHGADIHTQTGVGETILHHAFRMPALTKLLLAHHARTETANIDGLTALHYSALYDDHIKTTHLLLAAGADANQADKDGMTPLHKAALMEGAHTIKALYDAGAILDMQDAQGYTPLHHAIMHNKYHNAKALLELGANTALQDNNGGTPLDLAYALRAQQDIIRLLEEHLSLF